MILHDMALVHDPENGIYGDCFRACLATILQTPNLEDVPHFMHDGGEGWWNQFVCWCTTVGLDPKCCRAYTFTAPGYYILTGDSPRHASVLHSVVAHELNGIVHDPHPSRDGILPGIARDVLTFYLADTQLYDAWRKKL